MTLRVHIIEDSRTQAMELMILLEELGYEATHSTRLDEGIAHLDAHGADIVLLDLMLPDSERLDTLSRLIAEAGSTRPIVVLSVLAERELAIQALSLGAQDYLNKGHLEGEVLDRTLRYALERHRTHSELVRLTETLQQQNAELEALNALKNQFLGVATHDLRNPLSTIFMYTQILLARRLRAGLTDKHIDIIESVQEAAQFMRHLVDDLLDISTIESGNLELERVPTDLAALLRKGTERLGMLAERKHIRLELVLPEVPLPLAAVDVHAIEQILNNLVDNAIKFSEPGERIEIRLEPDGDTQAAITVRDHGPGIPSAAQDALFQPFGARSKGTAGERGTGLGLAIVRKIVDAHGGTITVDSTLGEGTAFRVVLSLAVDG